MKNIKLTINTCNDIQHNNISHLPNLFKLYICLFLFNNVFPAQFLLFIPLRGGHFVRGQDSVQLPHSPPFCNHLSGLTLEETRLSGLAIVAALPLFNYDAARFQDPFLRDREEMMRLYEGSSQTPTLRQ